MQFGFLAVINHNLHHNLEGSGGETVPCDCVNRTGGKKEPQGCSGTRRTRLGTWPASSRNSCLLSSSAGLPHCLIPWSWSHQNSGIKVRVAGWSDESRYMHHLHLCYLTFSDDEKKMFGVHQWKWQVNANGIQAMGPWKVCGFLWLNFCVYVCLCVK